MESLEQIGIKAKKASRYLAKLGIDEKNKALEAVADALTANAESIIAANEKDLVNAKANGMKPALIDRLTLDVKRINAMADGIRVLTGLEDPVGEPAVKALGGVLVVFADRAPEGVDGHVHGPCHLLDRVRAAHRAVGELEAEPFQRPAHLRERRRHFPSTCGRAAPEWPR